MAQEFMHKNKLQEYAQRCAIALPIYHTINEGSPHAPVFRSNVTVDGAVFTSASTFSNKKAAEQHVAKYALECIINNIKTNGIPLIHHVCRFGYFLAAYCWSLSFFFPSNIFTVVHSNSWLACP